jgi:hypothetical protein
VLISIGVAGALQASQNAMSFFVTSERPWQGRDLGRLAGADAHSQKLAAALLAAWTDCDRRRRDCLMRMVPGSLSVVVSADSLNHARQDGGKAHRRQHSSTASWRKINRLCAGGT